MLTIKIPSKLPGRDQLVYYIEEDEASLVKLAGIDQLLHLYLSV
jgi:hypothetical protein